MCLLTPKIPSFFLPISAVSLYKLSKQQLTSFWSQGILGVNGTSEKPRFYGQNKLFFENPTLQPLGSFSHMAACRSSLEKRGKMSLIPVFNKNLPQAHT
jgi:hypothetical protein